MYPGQCPLLALPQFPHGSWGCGRGWDLEIGGPGNRSDWDSVHDGPKSSSDRGAKKRPIRLTPRQAANGISRIACSQVAWVGQGGNDVACPPSSRSTAARRRIAAVLLRRYAVNKLGKSRGFVALRVKVSGDLSDSLARRERRHSWANSSHVDQSERYPTMKFTTDGNLTIARG
jgi:hypothetical protein